MGKPAARLGDVTAHGGTITLGNPMVLIGKMPASALGDMHLCPMCTPVVPPIPHVGGPILLGSTGVFIGKKPAARLSDMALCVGPPSMPAMGCMTVLLGEAGSGTQAGGAGTAAAALAAKKKGPKAIAPFPLTEPGPATSGHYIECEFVDSAGKPLQGVAYLLTDPAKAEIVGVSATDGKLYHGGYPQSGSYDLHVPEVKSAKWKEPKVRIGESASFCVETDLPDDVTELMVNIFENRGARRKLMTSLVLPIKGNKAEGTWRPGYTDIASEYEELDPGSGQQMPELAGYDFVCEAMGVVAISDTMRFVDDLEFELLDEKGEPLPGAEYEVAFASGEIRTGKLDGQGKAKIEEVEPGEVDVRFPKVRE